MKLIIVESPTKAKTLSGFLGKDYACVASYGHIRDLPKKDMGIDIENNFTPHYVVSKQAKAHLTEIKNLVKKADTVILATDADREGEAIAWHILAELKNGKDKTKMPPVERIVFHEIVKSAIQEALEHPRKIDDKLVNAQQARRILDRIVGYQLSPVLWKKIKRGLSAGRVQSPTIRLIVEREAEINKFQKQEYWSITAKFTKLTTPEEFTGNLYKINEKSIDKLDIKNEQQAKDILQNLEGANYIVSNIVTKTVKRYPNAPFITSTLQQEASNKLGFSTKQTMVIAQQLYEGIELSNTESTGLITYMRTDATTLSGTAVSEIKNFISHNFGDKYLNKKPAIYKKSKYAQEAHEAIRPTSIEKTPESIKKFLDKNQYKLYELIWEKTLASQMSEAVLNDMAVEIQANTVKNTNYTFRCHGATIQFDGFLKIYPNYKNDEDVSLPPLCQKEKIKLINLTPDQHFTKPPARYTEASLIKMLEKNGIGRPSTYAPIMSTIIDRGYVEKNNKELVPTEIGTVVNNLLTSHFHDIVDLAFTANMEKQLDDIAEGKREWTAVLKTFYDPFKEKINNKTNEIEKYVEKIDRNCPTCGKPFIIRFGRFGKFISCSDYPNCKTSEPLPEEKAIHDQYNNIDCDLCGHKMTVKHSRFGMFIGCSNYPTCKNIKKIEKKINMPCSECKIGEMVERRNKRKKIFYSCNRYPECKFILNKLPEINDQE